MPNTDLKNCVNAVPSFSKMNRFLFKVYNLIAEFAKTVLFMQKKRWEKYYTHVPINSGYDLEVKIRTFR